MKSKVDITIDQRAGVTELMEIIRYLQDVIDELEMMIAEKEQNDNQ